MRQLAERLIAYEVGARAAGTEEVSAAVLVSETLRPHLATLMGKAGFVALLSRSLALATTERPWMRTIHVNPDGTLGGWDELGPKITPEHLADGSVTLVAQLLGLMVAFVGEDLTLRMVRDMWTDMSLADLDLRKEDNP